MHSLGTKNPAFVPFFWVLNFFGLFGFLWGVQAFGQRLQYTNNSYPAAIINIRHLYASLLDKKP